MKKLIFFALFYPLFAAAQVPATPGIANTDSIKNVNIVKYYTKQIAQNPKDATAYYKRGDAKLNLNMYKRGSFRFKPLPAPRSKK